MQRKYGAIQKEADNLIRSNFWISATIEGVEKRFTDDYPFLGAEVTIENGDKKINKLDFPGHDGVITGQVFYGEFQLIIQTTLLAKDSDDYNLILGELRSLLYRENYYYVRHSKLPARQYAIDECLIEDDRLTDNSGTIKFTFNCFKGFSESLATSTVPLEYNEEVWGIGLNLPDGEDLQYVFSDEPIFNLYNPSDMRINPRFHPLSIALTCDSKPGQNVRIYNRTNGTLFELQKQVKKSDILLIDGVYPYLNDKRCGIDTNHGLITLERGWNRVQVVNAENITVAFDFPFYYRG